MKTHNPNPQMPLNKQNSLFFLGGHDLEMLEIKNILLEEGYSVIDNNLQWGAKLSDYASLFSDEKYNVCIELSEDIPSPLNYIRIDHHNELSIQKSSIEQVAELIGISLNRYQSLVSANDKGHIPAMKELKASDEEIQSIRKKDRQLQGITEVEESQAEENIKSRTIENNLTIVKTQLKHFSPIADRLFGKTEDNLLIYNELELCYYGKKRNVLVKKFANLIEEKKAYYGGQPNGFFGLASGSFTKIQINECVQKIEGLLNIYSHHIFLFPFKWDYIPKGKEMRSTDFDTRSNLEDFEKLLDTKKVSDKPLWKRPTYQFNEGSKDYNEYTFFYDFVRDLLYDTKQENGLIRYFECNIGCNASIEISTFKEVENDDNYKEDNYMLSVKGISMHIFRTGVGVLTFNLENYDYKEPEQILRINEYGRRIYPQFLGDKEPYTVATKKAFLANYINLDLDNGSVIEKESFENYDTKITSDEPFYLPTYIKSLFPDCFVTNSPNAIKNERVTIRNIMDDRMFTLCWYGNNLLANELSGSNKKGEYKYESNPFWYAMMVCDKNHKSITCKHSGMLKDAIKDFTYERWADYGTLYGITRETFMVISSDLKTLRGNSAPEIPIHLQSMYYQIVILCLIQRASILRFSEEITLASDLAQNHEESKDKLVDRINGLYKSYIEFVNRIYYREVTAQVQGNELYDKLQKQMRLNTEVTNLDGEIAELNQYAEMQLQKKLTETVAYYTPAALLVSILGLIGIDKIQTMCPKDIVTSQVLSFVYFFLLIIGTVYFSKPIFKLTSKMANKFF